MQFLLKGNPAVNAIVASVLSVALLIASFSLFEPIVAHGDQEFTVTQEVTSEISFLTDPNDVVMDTPLTGITGGSSLGTTTFNVTTNNAAGYTVSIVFSSTTAMNSTSSPNLHIDNYSTGDANGDWDMSVSSGNHGFAYSVYNETTPLDAASPFLDGGGSDCTGTTVAAPQQCWFNKSDAASSEDIIDTNSPTVGTGATTSIVFQVQLGTNSGVETGWYVATATLTAAVK